MTVEVTTPATPVDQRSAAPEALRTIADQVAQGTVRSETVRTLLSWFGAERRGSWVVQAIREALGSLSLKTEPDFEEPYLDAEVVFVAAPTPPASGASPRQVGEVSTSLDVNVAAPPVALPRTVDLVPRIRLLRAANNPPQTVSRDTSVREAVTVMLTNDYSQLPVMNGRSVVGLFSWKTLGEARTLGKTCEVVRQCMDASPLVLEASEPLLDAVTKVAAHEVAVIRDKGQVVGIVTTSDLSLEFHKLARPFLLLGSIENNLRPLMEVFDAEALRQARAPELPSRDVQTVWDMNFGEYVRILQADANWQRISQTLDRGVVTQLLDDVRKIRNDVMHFHPDPVGEAEIRKLENLLRVVQEMRSARDDLATQSGAATS